MLISKQLLQATVLAVFACCFFGCASKKKIEEVDPAFSKYIEAYTSGVISKRNTIRIKLAADAMVTHTLNEAVKEQLFDLSPGVDGKAYWTDARTIELKPSKDLKPDALYTVKFSLGKVMDVPDKFSTFTFNVQTIKPDFEVHEN
ncbi:MAG: Ig-like domain-containing protein, partial [Ilyomonas sp.]